MQFTRSKTALRAVNPPRPPPFIVDGTVPFDPFEPQIRQGDGGQETSLTAGGLVHIACVGLLGLLAVVAAPWWAFVLLAFAWLSATWAA